jgi:hypothetical protein
MSFKFWLISILAAAITFGNVSSAVADTNHAKSTIFVKSQSRCAPPYAPADATVNAAFGRYRVSHEEMYSNYTYGNAGSGHAHHHGSSEACVNYGRMARDNGANSREAGPGSETPPPPPRLGSKGTSQYIKQTWRPNAAGDKIDVAWTPDSFLQVDSSELTRGGRIVSRASLTAPSLKGTIELSVRLDQKRKPKVDTQLTGIFKGLRFELVSHSAGVVSLQFRQPLTWTVPGKAETFDIALDASIDAEGKQ